MKELFMTSVTWPFAYLIVISFVYIMLLLKGGKRLGIVKRRKGKKNK